MGNSICASSNNRDDKDDLVPAASGVDAMQAAKIVCLKHSLKIKGTITYNERCDKWHIAVESSSAGGARLELFRGPVEKLRGAHWKWLKGEHLMPFNEYCVERDFHCFLYQSQGNVRQYVKQLAPEEQRETIIVALFVDIVEGLRDLHRQQLYHSALSWEVVEVDDNRRGRVGALECVKPLAAAKDGKLAHVHHLPVEVLKGTKLDSGADVDKVEAWILGSMLLEITLNSYIGGPDFLPVPPTIQRQHVLHNIKRNLPRLVLVVSTLGKEIQYLIRNMLQMNAEMRLTLDQSLAHLRTNRRDQLTPEDENPQQVESTSAEEATGSVVWEVPDAVSNDSDTDVVLHQKIRIVQATIEEISATARPPTTWETTPAETARPKGVVANIQVGTRAMSPRVQENVVFPTVEVMFQCNLDHNTQAERHPEVLEREQPESIESESLPKDEEEDDFSIQSSADSDVLQIAASKEMQRADTEPVKQDDSSTENDSISTSSDDDVSPPVSITERRQDNTTTTNLELLAVKKELALLVVEDRSEAEDSPSSTTTQSDAECSCASSAPSFAVPTPQEDVDKRPIVSRLRRPQVYNFTTTNVRQFKLTEETKK